MTTAPSLILIAGGPGAGKTAIGRELARRDRHALLLDKDVLGTPWVDAMLGHLNADGIDRDSKLYWDILRPLEYSSMLAVAMDNLALGKSVIAVAPFGPELRDEDWILRLQTAVGEIGARLRVIWIETDPETARLRMVARDDRRDIWKLAHWDDFTAVAQFGPPHRRLHVLHNTGRAPLSELVDLATNYLQSN